MSKRLGSFRTCPTEVVRAGGVRGAPWACLWLTAVYSIVLRFFIITRLTTYFFIPYEYVISLHEFIQIRCLPFEFLGSFLLFCIKVELVLMQIPSN
jgi:hypothetical protein